MNHPPEASPPDAEPERLRLAIAALENQRALLGDAVTDIAVAPLRQRLFSIENVPQVRRAQVTVLFMDIVESMALAGRLDAEDVLSVFSGLLQRAADCVQARGGRVLRFTGDGLKAAFGTQGAREDDAVRAVQSGLDILAAAQQEARRLRAHTGLQGLAVRVGVHTGEAAFGAGHEAQDTLSGDAVNIAARMEQAAPPGALRVSADTWAQVRGRFIAEPQAPLLLKGLSQPMHTWLVRAPAAEGSGGADRGIEGLRVPLVGRQGELARLQQALSECVPRGRLQAITLIGDAGLGKSRLLREALNGQIAGVTLLQARAQPRDGLRSWGLLRQIVTGHCRIADSDSAEAARSKLLAGLTATFAADADLQAALIGQLIGLDFAGMPLLQGLDARALHDRALAAWLAWLEGLARRRPGLVLLIEDLHSADEASLDALTHLMRRGRALPMALLMSTRPELLERRPGWGELASATGAAGDTNLMADKDADADADAARITLAPLPSADSDTFAAALLPGLQPLPPALRALLTERAEGNPYYMEELVRRLLDDGVIRRDSVPWQLDEERLGLLKLPTTLVGLLQARLDALPAAEREGVQRASIVGHVFWDAALAQIDPAAVGAITALRQRSWVQAHDPSAFDGTIERRFDHHLLHQVTYGTVLKADRRRGHAAVARWLAERTAGRGPEFLAITGEHAERAGDAALAADCYERASAEAGKRFANTLAIDCLQRALALMATDDAPRRLNALDRLCTLADVTGNRSLQRQALDTMMAVLDRHPDPYRLAEVTFGRAMLADRQGRLDAAFELATEALAQATACGNDAAAAKAHAELCWLHCLRKNHAAAQQHQGAGLVCAERVFATQPGPKVRLIYMGGRVAYVSNRMADFGSLMEQALELAQACADHRMQLGALEALGLHAEATCDFARAARLAGRYLTLARELGDIRQIGNAHYKVGLAALLGGGDTDQALAAAAQSLAAARACGDAMECHAQYLKGLAHQVRGDAGAARDAYDEAAAAYAVHQPQGTGTARMRASAACQALRLGDIGAARDGLQQVLASLGSEVRSPDAQHSLESGLACVEILTALGDPRGPEMLEALKQRVRALSLERGGSPEAALQLQQRYPIYRSVMDAPASFTTSAATS